MEEQLHAPTRKDIKRYLRQSNPAGLRNARVERNLTPKDANNHFNWILGHNGKKYVMRIARPKGNLPSDITIEYFMLSLLKKTGIAPQPYWIDPKGFLYPLVIEDFIDGKMPAAKSNAVELKAIARTLAQLHTYTLPTSIPLEGRNYQQRFGVLQKRIEEALREPLIKNFAKESGLPALMPRIKKFFVFAAKFSDHCPRVLLHGDLYPGNVLITKNRAKNQQAILIDFQKPSVGDPTFDFGNLFVDVSRRKYYDEFKGVFVSEYLRHHTYPKLAELFDLRMIERDITSVISELRDASIKFPRNRMALQKYFGLKKPQWRTHLIKQGLERLPI